jgi:uncharacterized membrane protein
MTETQKWPILHILVGIPIVLTIAALIGAALEGWSIGKVAVLYGATMTTPVGMAYTFLVTLVERSYYMVFWAREKIRQEMRAARAAAAAEGLAEGEVKNYRKWQAWYERMQAAEREGRPFDEPPPSPPENRNGS